MKIRVCIFLGVLICIISIITIIPFSYAAERFFPIEQVKPGMKGEALTVFQGTQIASFTVKVIAVVDSDFDAGKLILVKLDGKKVRECGGLAAGMSGSPVYIKGALVGAISYGFENADPFLAYVTPIQSMLQLLDNSDKKEYFTYYRNSKKLLPVVTPVIISGIGRRGFGRLSETFRQWGLQAVYLPATPGGNISNHPKVPFKPGSAVAVQLVAGDYHAAAIGTVTMVEGKRFLAFGHSFTNRGAVDFLAYQAQIHHVVKSPALSMKLGSALYPVGRIYADRHNGIAGCLDEYPAMIDVVLNIKDLDRERLFHRDFRVIQNERFYRELITEVAAAAVDQAIDRVGSGTAAITFKIFTRDNPIPFTRDNLVYSKDIGVSVFKELETVLDAYATNEFCATKPRLVQIDLQIENRNTTAKVCKLEVDRIKAKPGESISAKVYLHSYRGTGFSKSFTVKIPDSLPPGKFILSVRGGSEQKTVTDETSKTLKGQIEPEIDSFQQLLESLADQPKNNELVLEVTEIKTAPAGVEPVKPVRIKVNTDFYLTGQVRRELEIEK